MTRLLIVALLIVTPPAFAQVANPPVTLDEYPVSDGSTSARPIARAVFLEIFGVPWRRAEQEAPNPYSAPAEDAIEPRDPDGMPEDVRAAYDRIADHSGTHEAYVKLIHGYDRTEEPALIFECRLPSVDERHELRSEGNWRVDLDCAPIARDAFIFIVRDALPVEGLSLEQVRGIFSGGITNWQEVGGADEPILAITRNRNSGSQETMRHLVMCGRDTTPMSEEASLNVEPAQDMFGPFGMLNAEYGQGIAYTFHSYWEHMVRRRGTKALAINGVVPSAETIASGEYPLCTDVYAVIRSSEADRSPAERLRNWLLTDAGQEVIEKTGYVSLRGAQGGGRGPYYQRATYPDTDASTSASPLADVVTATAMRVPWLRRVQQVHGIGGAEPDEITLTGLYMTDSWGLAEFRMQHYYTGTHNAWLRLLQHEADIIFECRLPSEDERAEIEHLGVEVDARPVAKDAFVFIMNEDAPIDNLTLQQIRDIYTGETTRWSEIGLQAEEPEEWDDTIEPWSRNRNSGSQETMISLVMGDAEMLESPGDFVTYDMHGPFGVLHAKTNAISFTFWSYHHLMLPDRHVKMLAVDGVYPTPDTIADGSYPLVTDTYAAVRASSPSFSPEVRLRNWLLTEQGQRTVKRSGYVPLGDGG